MAWILVGEVAVMFCFITIGVLCKIKGIINQENARAISNMLLLVIVPALMIRNLQSDYHPEILPAMLVTIAATIIYHCIAIFLTNRLVKDPGDGTTQYRVTKLASVLSNAGFMGFPLIIATVGDTGLIYGVLFIGVFNIVTWVWCVPTLTITQRLSPKQLLTNPAIVGLIVAMLLHFTGIRLPGVLLSVCNQVANLNTPLAMIIIGVFLAEIRPLEALRDASVYKTVLYRNLLFPLVMLAIVWLSRIAHWLPGGKLWALTFIISTSCPSATTSILMASRYGYDSGHGGKLVAASTLLSIVTIPLLFLLADFIL